MAKVVVNRVFGNFRIPKKLVKELGWYCVYFSGKPDGYDDRTAPDLIAALERMIENGEKIWPLEIVEVPDDVDLYIEEYDGKEWIAETHRTW